jgi:hypothetical protein
LTIFISTPRNIYQKLVGTDLQAAVNLFKSHERTKKPFKELTEGVQRLTDRCDDYKTVLDERLKIEVEEVRRRVG